MKMMKSVLLMLFAMVCCGLYAQEDFPNVSVGSRAAENCSCAGHDQNQAKVEKRYIDPSQVQFNQKEMYVQLDQNWVATNAVYTDADGFYILEAKGGWTCGGCGNYNEGNLWTCDRCGRRRD
jgi:hypothetical protein